MQYIVRFKGRKETKYWTVPAGGLKVRFKALHKRVGHVKGLGPIVEQTGVDKSMVTLRANTTDDDGARNARGQLVPLGGQEVKLLDRHSAIRVMSPESAETLALYDRLIEQKKRELAALRTTRAGAFEEIWKRGQKVDINDLEEKADEVLDR